MVDFKFSINSWLFGTASIETICRNAHEIGVEGIDISGEPDKFDLSDIRMSLQRYDLKPYCINGNFTDERRCICHGESDCRKSAIAYGKRLIDMAVALECPTVLMVPSQVNRQTHFVSRDIDWNHAVESLEELVAYAEQQGDVSIALECVNKYEVALVHSLSEGIAMCQEVGGSHIGIVGDTFHMQMEEPDGIANACRRAGTWLRHVHLGDNTREVPGKGCFDWRELCLALDAIEYKGVLSFEPLPHHLSGEQIFAGELSVDELTADLRWSHTFLKTMLQGMESCRLGGVE